MLNRDLHNSYLLEVLKAIYTDTSISPVLGFKGGTAAYFFYGLERFSVDLDFDLLEEDKQGEVFKKIAKILKKFGTIKEKYIKKNTVFFLLSYREELHNIKLEISKRNNGSQYHLQNHLGVPVLVMVREDMFAHKLVALLDRRKKANRDIFDVWFFLKNHWDVNQKLLEKRTGVSFKSYLKKCIGFIEALSDKYILDGMGELLDQKQKAWVKTKLKNEVLFLLRVRAETV